MKSNKGAIELSMTTIVVVVLSLTLLIMGFVLVRSIMCGSMNLVTDINTLSTDEVNKLFGSTAGEISCYGGGGQIKSVYTGYPSRTNQIGCIIKAPKEATYKFDLKINEKYSTIDDAKIKEWLVGGGEWEIAPGDEKPKLIGELRIPNNAEAGDIALDLTVKKNNDLLETDILTYSVSRVGTITNLMC